MTDALVLAILAIPLTAHALWFDRPKMGGRDPWAARSLYGLSWLCIAFSVGHLVSERFA